MRTPSVLRSGRGASAAFTLLAASAGLLLATFPAGADSEGGVPAPRSAHEAKVELGRRLFFDPAASRSGARSCASCHDPEHGFSDPAVRSDDDVNRTRRHSQTLLDGHLNPTAHWDGEFDSIEELVFARLGRVGGIKGKQGLGAHGPFTELGAGPVPTDPTGGETTGPNGVPLGTDAGGRSGRGEGGGGYGPSPTPSPGDPVPAPEPRDPDPPADPPTTPNPDDPEPPPEEPPTTPSDEEKKGPDGSGDRPAQRGKEAVKVLPLDLTKLPDVAETLEASGRYGEAFQAAFGSRTITTARLAEAIAAYCRTIRSTEAPIDRWVAGDRTALSEPARRGLTLFRGRAGCARCHAMEGQHPTFTDFEFHNTGVAWKGILRADAAADGDLDLEKRSDHGRETVSTLRRDRRAFKTPTLRDLARRGPYMHDGSFASLEAVVRHYATGAVPAKGEKDRRLDRLVQPFEASEQDVADLVAFLGALNGDERPGQAPRVWHARAERTRVQLLDGRRQPLAGFALQLVPEGDVIPGATRSARTSDVVTDADGWFEFVPGTTTHVRLALPDGLVARGGALVPDSCARAQVEVPVDGRVTLVVAFEKHAPAPERLALEHEGTMRLPGHPAPRTLLSRVTMTTLGGREVASYEGWRRVDVPPEAIVRMPGDGRARAEHRVRLAGAGTLKLDLGE